MAINIGSVTGHDGSSHHVTECSFDHTGKREAKAGTMRAADGNQAQTPAAGARSDDPARALNWFQNLLEGGRSLLGRIWGMGGGRWGDGNTAGKGEAASVPNPALSPPSTQAGWEANPYFHPVAVPPPAAPGRDGSVRERITARLGRLTGFSAGHGRARPGRGEQTPARAQRREKTADLTKYSRYREQDTEVECVITEDSYLLDSYDRKGGYSRIGSRDVPGRQIDNGG